MSDEEHSGREFYYCEEHETAEKRYINIYIYIYIAMVVYFDKVEASVEQMSNSDF